MGRKITSIHQQILSILAEKNRGLTEIAKELSRRTGEYLDSKKVFYPLSYLVELGAIERVKEKGKRPFYQLTKNVLCFPEGLTALIFGEEAIVLTFLCYRRRTCDIKDPSKCPIMRKRKDEIIKALRKSE